MLYQPSNRKQINGQVFQGKESVFLINYNRLRNDSTDFALPRKNDVQLKPCMSISVNYLTRLVTINKLLL